MLVLLHSFLLIKENIALTKSFNLKVNCSHFENSLDIFLATKIIDEHKKMSVATLRCNISMNGEMHVVRHIQLVHSP